jgi:hypothetical protein
MMMSFIIIMAIWQHVIGDSHSTHNPCGGDEIVDDENGHWHYHCEFKWFYMG